MQHQDQQHNERALTEPQPNATGRDICESATADANEAAPERTGKRAFTATQLEAATQRKRLLGPILMHVQTGHSSSAAVAWFYEWLRTDEADEGTKALAAKLGRNGFAPTRATLMRWLKLNSENGMPGLVHHFMGRQRLPYGWEARAIELYNQPSKPSMSAVAEWLRQEGFESAINHRVAHYIRNLPSTHNRFSKARMGASEYRMKSNFVMRSFDTLPVGFCYQGDGHCMDVYVAHPRTGKAWRPELTVWLDVKSRYVVGWYLSEAESSYSTLFSLSTALLAHDHVPAVLHIDNGAGFKSKMMNDGAVGFYERMSISTTFTIPGNPRGKGQVERFFGSLESRFGKQWHTFCGKDMAKEVHRRLADDVAKGRTVLPTLAEFKDALGNWIEHYNNAGHGALNGATPASVWATLERFPVELPEAAIVRPREEKTVGRFMVRLHNRYYRHAALAQYEKTKVTVEYDLHHDDKVWIRDRLERLICVAELVHKKEYLPDSRIAEYQQRRLAGQAKRLQQRLDEHEARATSALNNDFTNKLEATTLIEATQLEQGLDQIPGQLIDQNEEAGLLSTYSNHPTETPQAGADGDDPFALLEQPTPEDDDMLSDLLVDQLPAWDLLGAETPNCHSGDLHQS